MGEKVKNEHYQNKNITLELSKFTFEAESVAFTVCQYYGIDTSDYSFGYIAGWSSGKEIKELKDSINTIRKTANEIITSIDCKLDGIRQSRQMDMNAVMQKHMDAPKKHSRSIKH